MENLGLILPMLSNLEEVRVTYGINCPSRANMLAKSVSNLPFTTRERNHWRKRSQRTNKKPALPVLPQIFRYLLHAPSARVKSREDLFLQTLLYQHCPRRNQSLSRTRNLTFLQKSHMKSSHYNTITRHLSHRLFMHLYLPDRGALQ